MQITLLLSLIAIPGNGNRAYRAKIQWSLHGSPVGSPGFTPESVSAEYPTYGLLIIPLATPYVIFCGLFEQLEQTRSYYLIDLMEPILELFGDRRVFKSGWPRQIGFSAFNGNPPYLVLLLLCSLLHKLLILELNLTQICQQSMGKAVGNERVFQTLLPSNFDLVTGH